MTSPCTHSYTGPYLALEGVSYVLPDGRTLFPVLANISTGVPPAWSGAMASVNPCWRVYCPDNCSPVRDAA